MIITYPFPFTTSTRFYTFDTANTINEYGLSFASLCDNLARYFCHHFKYVKNITLSIGQHIVTIIVDMSHQMVIIGAGISGLYAACNLIDLEIKDILILEAQDRVGGRIHSIPLEVPEHDKEDSNFKGWIDLGAQFCHGSYNNHLYNFCNNNKV